MKNLKKLFAVVIAVAMMVTAMAPAFAAGAFSYEAEAQVLNDLGLYKGISETEFVPDLGTALNRETGVVMLLRIFGLEADAEAIADADAVLAKFSDAASISSWAKKAVAYAVENGLVQGLPDSTFAPKAALNGKAYSTLILRQLGYTPDYNNAPAELADKGGLTVLEAVKFTSKELVKDDLVGISYGALKAEYSDGATVIEKLIEANPDMEEVATTAGLVEELTITALASVPAVKVKVGATADLAKTVTATYSDKTTAEVAVTWDAVDTTKAGTVTVAGTVEGTELKASVTVTVEEVVLAVESVTALNAKQLQVVFNKTLDADSAKAAGNYEVKDLGSNVKAATPVLQSDNKTVILTLDGVLALTNSTNAKLTVKKDGVKAAADAKALTADYVNDAIKVYDGLIPEVSKVEAVGAKTLKLTFTEPVVDNGGNDTTLTNTDFVVKSGTYTYYVTKAEADFANKTVTLTLGTSLMAGEVTVTVNANGANSATAITDFAGIKAFKGDTKFTYASDTSVAAVTVKEISQTSVTLKFSKPVYGTAVTLFHSVKGVDAYKAQKTVVEASATDEWKFDYLTNKIPQGAVKLYLVNSSTDSEKITDLYGVKVPDVVIDANVTIDVTAPTVSSTELKDNNIYNVTFSEDIDTAEAKADNFAVKKVSDGKAVAFTVTNDAAKKAILTFSPVLEDNTAYEITVKAMKDKAGNSLAAQAVYNVNVGDNTAPSVKDAFVVDKGATDDIIYIVYSEPINAAQMADKTNYLIDPDGDQDDEWVALDDDDKVEAVTDRQVKITFHDGVADPDVKIAPVVDMAGKKIGNNSTIGYMNAKLQDIEAASLTISTAELIAKNKAKLTFNKEISSFNNTQFQFQDAAAHTPWAGVDALRISGVESLTKNDDGNTVATVILDHDVGTDAVYKTKTLEIENVAGSGTTTTSAQGIELNVAGNPRVALEDTCAPEISKIVFETALKIEVQLSENIDLLSIAGAGKNGFSVVGGELTTAIKGTANNVIILTGKDFTKNTDVVYTAGNLTDNSATTKNALATVTKSDELTLASLTAKQHAPVDGTFTIVNNYEGYTLLVGAIDMNAATAGVQNTIAINGITYTVTVAAGTATVAATAGAATATAVATTSAITITDPTGASDTMTLNIPGVTIGDAFGTVTVTVTE